MLRKIVNKIFSLKKKRSQPPYTTAENNQDYEGDADTEESDTTRIFRKRFITKFEAFRQEASMLAEGDANFNDSWKDTLGKEGLGVSITAIVGVIGILGALSILSAAASAGIAVPVAVVGMLAGLAFYKYREHIKRERFESADGIMQRDDISENIRTIAYMLADLYKLQLASCTVKDAHKLAESCVKAISLEMLKNDKFYFDELLNVSSLQAVLMRSLSRVPKEALDMNLLTTKKYNTRGVISHSAYYVRETGEFYQSAKSKSTKYGVLFFDAKEDLEGYESILTETMKHGEQWRFRKMRAHEVDVMLRSSMFKAYRNDEVFRDAELVDDDESEDSESEGSNDRMKVT